MEAQIDAWIADTSTSLRHSLIGDIEEFTQECDDLENDFESRYGAEFSIESWNMTPADFLSLLREKVFDSLS